MSEEETRKRVGAIVDEIFEKLETTAGWRTITANLRKTWTKVRTRYHRRQYKKAIEELNLIIFYAKTIKAFCNAQEEIRRKTSNY